MTPMASSGQCCSRMQLAALVGAGVVGQHVEAHHLVGQPAPDQRRQHQHQRRDEPQRQAQDQQHQRQQHAADRPQHGPEPARPVLALQRRRSGATPPGRTSAGVINQATSSSDSHHDHRHGQRHHDQRRQHRMEAGGADRIEPLQEAHHQRPLLQRGAHAGDRALPSRTSPGRAPAATANSSGSSDSRMTRGMQAIGRRTPERIEQLLHARSIGQTHAPAPCAHGARREHASGVERRCADDASCCKATPLE